MNHAEMKKWIPLVKRLARKAKPVNLMFMAEDLEQEAWTKIIKYWPKMQGMTDLQIEKHIKTIFNNHTIDLRRAAMRRPDTHWSYRSNVIDPMSRSVSASAPAPRAENSKDKAEDGQFSYLGDKEIKNKAYRFEAGRFSADVFGPEELLLHKEASANLLNNSSELLSMAEKELERATEATGKNTKNRVRDASLALEQAKLAHRLAEAIVNGECDCSSLNEFSKGIGLSPSDVRGALDSIKQSVPKPHKRKVTG